VRERRALRWSVGGLSCGTEKSRLFTSLPSMNSGDFLLSVREEERTRIVAGGIQRNVGSPIILRRASVVAWE